MRAGEISNETVSGLNRSRAMNPLEKFQRFAPGDKNGETAEVRRVQIESAPYNGKI